MIRMLQNILIGACLVLLFFIAFVILCQRAPWSFIENIGTQVLAIFPPAAQNIILILAMAAVVVIGGLTVRHLRSETQITKMTDDGSITIVESALTRYVRQVAMDIDPVQSARAKISNTHNGIVVDLFTRVRVTDSLPRIERLIRERTKAAVEETLGLAGIASINVVIENFEPAKKKKAEAPEEKTPVSRPPATVAESGFRTGAETTPGAPETLDAGWQAYRPPVSDAPTDREDIEDEKPPAEEPDRPVVADIATAEEEPVEEAKKENTDRMAGMESTGEAAAESVSEPPEVAVEEEREAAEIESTEEEDVEDESRPQTPESGPIEKKD